MRTIAFRFAWRARASCGNRRAVARDRLLEPDDLNLFRRRVGLVEPVVDELPVRRCGRLDPLRIPAGHGSVDEVDEPARQGIAIGPGLEVGELPRRVRHADREHDDLPVDRPHSSGSCKSQSLIGRGGAVSPIRIEAAALSAVESPAHVGERDEAGGRALAVGARAGRLGRCINRCRPERDRGRKSDRDKELHVTP